MNERYLRATPLLNYEHPSLQRLIEARGWSALAPRQRIAAVYTYVRDGIAFGYNATDAIPATEVLADGCGQCNTKTTLLMALLRGAGVPSRFHGGAIDKRLQKGLVTGLFYRLAPASIVHTWAEVLYEGGWLELEGVILDRPYLDGLRKAVPNDGGAFLGYGVGTECLAAPPIEFRGTDTYIQATGVNRDYGLFDDPDSFYAAHGSNLAGLKDRLYRGWVRHRMNRRVASIRGCAPRAASAAAPEPAAVLAGGEGPGSGLADDA